MLLNHILALARCPHHQWVDVATLQPTSRTYYVASTAHRMRGGCRNPSRVAPSNTVDVNSLVLLLTTVQSPSPWYILRILLCTLLRSSNQAVGIRESAKEIRTTWVHLSRSHCELSFSTVRHLKWQPTRLQRVTITYWNCDGNRKDFHPWVAHPMKLASMLGVDKSSLQPIGPIVLGSIINHFLTRPSN